MKRILAWLCGLLSALGITACDYINVKELKPGVSTSAEVRERFGPPHMEWRNEDGSLTWEFSRQPEGIECFMITIGPDQILRRIDQVLNEETFAKVQHGMNGDQVRRLLGKPRPASSSSSSRRRCGSGGSRAVPTARTIRSSSRCRSTTKGE